MRGKKRSSKKFLMYIVYLKPCPFHPTCLGEWVFEETESMVKTITVYDYCNAISKVEAPAVDQQGISWRSERQLKRPKVVLKPGATQ